MKKDIHSKIIVALTQPKAGRVRFIKDVVSSRHLKDIKYVEMLVNSLSDKSAVFADFMADEVIWQLGLDMMSLLVGDFNEQKEAVKYRRLRVIKRFDKLVAKTLARENVYSRHYGLPLECIALLSGSIEDAELLIELAKSKPEERVIAAFTSLRGIENEDVIDFLSHCLKTGVGFPELTLSYFHVPTLSNVIKVNLTSLLEKLEKGPCLSSSDARHLILLLRASAGQNLTKFDTVFIRATKLALCDIPIPEDYYLFQLDFMEATFEAVVSNPASESQKLLIKERDRVSGHLMIFPFCAASFYDAISLYEMFFRDLKALNHRGRCRGWKCGCKASPWPCSVVSAIEFAIKNEDAQLLSESILPCQLLLVKKIRSDERWKDAVENLEFSDV